MATERWLQIRCDSCGSSSEAIDVSEMTETQLRADLKKRFGWLMWKQNDGKRKDVCPGCQQAEKKGL